MKLSLGDPDIGLHLGEVIPVLSGQITEYLFMSSPNFGEGLKRSAKYTRLLSDLIGIDARLDEKPCRIVNSLHGLEDPDFAHQHVSMLLAGLRFYQQITAGAFKPSRASIRCKVPVNVAEYQRVFGCPLEFDAEESALYFEPELLLLASVHAEPNLLSMHERMADQQIQHLDKLNLLVEVRRIIGETLETGCVSLEFVAGRLGIKSSRLRANLASLETSFNQVLSGYRFSLVAQTLDGNGREHRSNRLSHRLLRTKYLLSRVQALDGQYAHRLSGPP